MSIDISTDKKKLLWERPKLIVLGRGEPEERVLLGCKVKSAAGAAGNDCKGINGHGTCHAKTDS